MESKLRSSDVDRERKLNTKLHDSRRCYGRGARFLIGEKMEWWKSYTSRALPKAGFCWRTANICSGRLGGIGEEMIF